MKKKKFIIFYLFIIFFFFFFFCKLIDKTLNNIYGLGNPLIYNYSKIYGYEIKPNQKIKRLKNNISINNEGMRTTNDWPKSSLSKSYKILFYGDSVTYGGSVVSNKDLFTEKVCHKLKEKKLKSFCGNFGVNGYGLFSIIKRIKYKKIDNEDLIVITIIGSDFTRGFNHIGNQPFWEKKILNYFPAFTESLFILIDKFRNKTKYKFEDSSSTLIDYKFYNDNLKEFNDVLNANGKNYIIFYSPSLDEINGSNQYSFFKKILNKNSNFFDLSKIKYKNKKELYHDNVHLNKKGHEVYSNFISKKIFENYK